MTTYTLLWVSRDKQGFMPMGEFPSVQDAYAAVPAALDVLLAECADDESTAEIHSGSFQVEENDA